MNSGIYHSVRSLFFWDVMQHRLVVTDFWDNVSVPSSRVMQPQKNEDLKYNLV